MAAMNDRKQNSNEINCEMEYASQQKHMAPGVFLLLKMTDFSGMSKRLEFFEDFVHALFWIKVRIKRTIRRWLGQRVGPQSYG